MVVGAIVGALMVRVLVERVGRRNALIINGGVNVFSALLEFSAKYVHSPEMLIVGRLVIGANMGFTTGVVPM
jgi:MFS family permease